MVRRRTQRIIAPRKRYFIANVPMETFSNEQWETYRSATKCHICEKPFTQDDSRVRDYCHLTRRYTGAAHSNCNLNYKNSFYSIVFHNLSGYDLHFIIKEIATAFEGKVDLLPITKEKYISFTKSRRYRRKIKITKLHKIAVH